jgi:transcriptional regulator with XRE-family HTH domain/fido (protein-threonine AMPylation protein)
MSMAAALAKPAPPYIAIRHFNSRVASCCFYCIICDTISCIGGISMDNAESYIKIRRGMVRLLVDERKAQKLTQGALAEKLHIQRSNLARFERGEQNPSLDFLIKVAVALGKEPDFVLRTGAYQAFEKIPANGNGGTRMEPAALLKQIDGYKAAIDSRRPLTQEEIKELDDYFRIGLTYTSNALEGNTLTISETKVIIEDGITVGGKPLKDCYEATGHAKAYDYMLSAARAGNLVFSEEMVLALHRLFYSSLDVENAGKYRTYQVFITGTEYVPPDASEVPALMGAFISELNGKSKKLHPVTLAAFAHRRLVDIHPFTDGNGRTARLLMNLILVNRGYQIVSVPPVLRVEYIGALHAAQRSENPSDEAFFQLIAECEIEAQKDYCRMFRIDPPGKRSGPKSRL